MRIDTDDLVSATELSRNSPWLLKEASLGRRFVIVKGNTPTAALISMDDLNRLASVAPTPTDERLVDDSPPHRVRPDAFLASLGIDDVDSWDPRRSWSDAADNIVVQLGLSTEGLVALDLAESGPHGLLAGMTGAGKSTGIRAIVLSLCARYGPDRVQIALAACKGGFGFADLEHVPQVSVFREEETFVAWADEVITQRSSPGGASEDDPAWVIIVDEIGGWETPDFTSVLGQLLGQDPGSQIHVLLASQCVPARIPMERINYRIVLRVRDMAESRNIMASARATELGFKGDAYLVVGDPTEHSSTRLRLFDPGDSVAHKLIDGICATQLPSEIAFADLDPLPSTAPSHALRIGVGVRDMSTAWLDLDLYPHVYCVGTPGSGRTMFLRTVCAAIMEAYTPEEAQVIIVDPQLSIGEALSKDYRMTWAAERQKTAEAVEELAQRLQERRPPAGLEPGQLRNWKPQRSKWFILVDDLTLLSPAGSAMTPLQPLVPAAETARLLDLHIIAAVASDTWYARGRANKLIGAMDHGGASVVVLDGDSKDVIVGDIRPARRIPGRAELYVRKGGGQLIQIAQPPDLQAAT